MELPFSIAKIVVWKTACAEKKSERTHTEFYIRLYICDGMRSTGTVSIEHQTNDFGYANAVAHIAYTNKYTDNVWVGRDFDFENSSWLSGSIYWSWHQLIFLVNNGVLTVRLKHGMEINLANDYSSTSTSAPQID